MSDTQSIGFIFNLEQINKLILEKNRLENQLLRQGLQNEINRLEQEIQNLVLQNMNIQQLLQTEINKLQQLLNIKNNEINKLHEIIDKQENKINKLNETLKLQKKEINELKEENKKLNKFYEQYKIDIIYKKAFDNTEQIRDDLINLFCNEESEIYKLSRDNAIKYLVKHLQEYRTQNYSRFSSVKKYSQQWKQINDRVIKLLETEFKIYNIDLFFALVNIKETRNKTFHTDEKITLEELKIICPNEADELYNYIFTISPTL